MSTASDSNTTEVIPPDYAVTILQQKNIGNWGTKELQKDNAVQVFTGWIDDKFSYSASAEYSSPFQAVMGSGLVPVLSLFGLKAMAPAMTAQLWSGSETPTFSMNVELTANADPLTEIRDPIINLLNMVTPRTGSLQDSGAIALQSPGPYVNPADMWDKMKQAFPPLSKIDKYVADEGTSSGARQDTGMSNAQAAAKNKPPSKQGTTINTSQQAEATSGVSLDGALDSSTYIRSVLNNQISISIGRYIYFPSVAITEVDCEFLHQIGPNGWPMQATVGIQFKPMFLPTQDDLLLMFGKSQRR